MLLHYIMRITALLYTFLTPVLLFSSPNNLFKMRNMIQSGILSSLAIPKSSKSDDTNVNEMYAPPLTLYFYGSVSEDTCFQLTRALGDLDVQAKKQKVLNPELKPHISLHLQSGGGSLMPAFYVCDYIKTLDTPVHTYVDGYVASAASLISVSGDKRFMTAHSSILIHQLTGATSGKFNELKDEMSNLNYFMNKVRQIYLSSTRLDENTLDDLLCSDIWLNASTCINYGIVDKVI